MKLIFDLDLTLIGSQVAEPYRPSNWQRVYRLIPSFTAYEGMTEVLSHLRAQEIDYCIVTSSPETYCRKVCDHWGYCTDYLVTYYDVPRSQRKPHPAPILLALQKMKMSREEVLSFGDRDIDIQSSNAAGVRSVACLWGAADPKSLLAAKPTYVIKQPGEIIGLVEKEGM